MSNLIRWEPARQLSAMQDAMDRFFGGVLARPLYEHFYIGAPAMDVNQTEDDIVVEMALPGIKPEDAHISIAGGILSVKGEAKSEKKIDEAAYHLRERRDYTFDRSVTLPCEVEEDNAEAEFEDGILTITLPKAEEVKSKIIKVRARK